QHLRESYLNPPDSEIAWLIGRAYGGLGAELEIIDSVENKLKRASRDVQSTPGWLQLADELVASYSRFGAALQRDAAIKQTTIAALQFAGLLYLMFCIARIAL